MAAALLAHGLIENGGVVHALEGLTAVELAAAAAGFRYFGLAHVAEVLEQVPDDSEETEERLNRLYREALPGDDALAHAFRSKLLACPEAFAPTDP